MQIQVETDNHLKSSEDLSGYVKSALDHLADRFADELTHIEAHLGDNNSQEKSGAKDMRCMLEARIAGVKTIAVTHQAESLQMAIDGAADKLERAIEHSVEKLQDRQRRAEGTGHLSADILEQQPE